jgi:hypothetical protein
MPTNHDPCAACPWRASNQGKRHPDGWYTKANLRRLWAKLRAGENMTCHPTDRDNPVSPRAVAAGYRVAGEHAKTRECMGSVILQQREFTYLQDDCAVDLARYRREHPRGLTQAGVLAMVHRAMFGGAADSVREALGHEGITEAMPAPNLNEPDVAYAPLGNWAPRRA